MNGFHNKIAPKTSSVLLASTGITNRRERSHAYRRGDTFGEFAGHYLEGRKPAFVDDIVGLLIGPLFVVAEWGFALGLRSDLQRSIAEKQPT